jgi:hypothetical protein
LEHHIFSIGAAFVECAAYGAKDLQERAEPPLEDGTFMTGDEMAGYGGEVIARIEAWWSARADKSCQEEIEIVYPGITIRSSLNKLLERCVWHSAHHTRQIADLLEKRWGIAPDGRMTAEDLAGLPLPTRVWE